MAAERWQQVGEELGLTLPAYVGKLVLPLFDREARGGSSIVETERGLVIARLIDGEGVNKAGLPNRQLVTATAATDKNRGWAMVETHVPRAVPESPWGPELCRINDYGQNMLWFHVAPRTGAMAGVDTPHNEYPSENQMRDEAVAKLDPLVNAEGVDLFHPDNAELARDALHGDFAGHIFDHAVRQALQERFGVEPALPPPLHPHVTTF
jgi:hypothetical protein